MRKFLLLFLTLCLLAPLASAHAQGETPGLSAEEQIILEMLQRMSPLEKAGQLMLVTFNGTDVSENSEIIELIQDYHIGGVVLSTKNENFTDVDAAQATQALITALQESAYQKSLGLPATGHLKDGEPVYIPLYVAHLHAQADNHSERLLPALNNLPSEMTLGASWSPELSNAIGQIYGAELSSLGFNLFLGPNLDLIDTSDTSKGIFTGTSSFGANPYWVGKIANAFVGGIHTGSNNRMAVVATHFPGLGGADRPINQEVSTIQRSLDQLVQNELAPFLALTGASHDATTVDGVMTSHIRFQGLQGNVLSTTKPVSFDPIALQQLFSVPPLNTWQANGGLTVSDSLGNPAVRSFFDPTGLSFDAPAIARTAFLAGNDILYLDNFATSIYESQTETIKRTISFFAQKYQEDTVFAQRVDESVGKILKNKLGLYDSFSLKNVISDTESEAQDQPLNQLNLEIARESLTLLAPKEDYLNTIFNEGPRTTDYITVFSDTRSVLPCETCSRINTLGVDDFKNTLLGLYGSQGTNQIVDYRINSYTFAQLSDFLNDVENEKSSYLEEHLKRARWIIFNVQNLSSEIPSSSALKHLLADHANLLRDKMVIVFAYRAPFYLDSTEVSKLTAYYGLFTPSKASLELAARVLMHEARAKSALPYSLPAVAYDLQYQLAPDPKQIINLDLVTDTVPVNPDLATPLATDTIIGPEVTQTPVPLFRLGEAVRIQAGPILDRNGNIVPDGTLTKFTIKMVSDALILALPEATTVNGYATIEYRVEREGIFAVTASTGEASTSATLILTTQGGLAEIIMPTSTPMPEPSRTPEPTPTPQPTPAPVSDLEEGFVSHPTGYPSVNDWLLTIMLLITGFGISYAIGYFWWKGRQWAIRSGLCTVLGGLVAYLTLSLGIPWLSEVIRKSGTWFVIQTSIVGMLIGWIASLIWWLRHQARKKKLDIPN